MQRLLLLLLVHVIASGCAAQKEESMADAFRRGLKESEEKRIRDLQPTPLINGSLFTDSAYFFKFRFNVGDSILDKSSNGQVIVIIQSKMFYARINSVSTSASVKDYAKQQRKYASEHPAEGATKYKVSKLREDQYRYSYDVKYISKDGMSMVSTVRIMYAQHKYSMFKIAAVFPDDENAAAQQEHVDYIMHTLEAFS